MYYYYMYIVALITSENAYLMLILKTCIPGSYIYLGTYKYVDIKGLFSINLVCEKLYTGLLEP